jgi:simple sugar transport system ATP-binding protein
VSARDAGGPIALELRAVDKRFGAVQALRGADLRVRRGTVHALLGENGAGKTTLMRVVYGMVRPDAGAVLVDGAPLRAASPAAAIAAGVGMVHQHFTIVPAMTVAENVALGATGRARGSLRGGWLHDARAAAEQVQRVATEAGLPLEPETRARELPVSAQQRLEIVKALVHDARVLILDEPTAVLAPAEARELLAWLRRFADGGRTAVLITHKLREALSVADEVTVLRRGATVATLPAAAASEDAVRVAMLGELTAAAHSVARPSGSGHASATRRAVVLRARDLTVRDERGILRVRAASLEVASGEIVGVAGVEGAGQRELLWALAGRLAPAEGVLERPPEVGFVPEDRQRDALVLDFTLRENVALRGAGARRGRTPWGRIAERTARLLPEHDVRASGPETRARTLSGGNQQKLVLARELDGEPAALVAENPTRGLDVRAADTVQARLRAARDAGTAVVFYSSDLDEVLALADRVLVVFNGSVREVPRERDAVGRAMLGV